MDILDTKAAAAYLGQPSSTLAYWRSTGYGPRFFTMGRRIMYRRSELERFVERQEVAAATAAGRSK